MQVRYLTTSILPILPRSTDEIESKKWNKSVKKKKKKEIGEENLIFVINYAPIYEIKNKVDDIRKEYSPLMRK